MKRWLLVILVGCGTPETRTVYVEKDAEVIVIREDSGAASPIDSGTLPELDAAAEACVAPPMSTDLGSDDCVLEGACPTCAEGLSYRCRSSGGTVGQPKIGLQLLPNCRRFALDSVLAETRYCCPPACVRSKRSDGSCFATRPNFYTCPTNAGTPKPACSFSGTDQAAGITNYCCE